MIDQFPTVCVVIPTWNGKRMLERCLEALQHQEYSPTQIVVVDNGSTDGTGEWLRRHDDDRVTVVSFSENRGFAAGVNAGIAASRTAFIALLNNDVLPEPGWLSALVEALRADPQSGSCASKMLFAHDRQMINSAGDTYSLHGIPGNRGVWQVDRGQYDESALVFGACAGAALYRAEALAAVGPFDESFVSYCEDVDWAFRAQLAGFTCRYVPSARVYHIGSATGGGAYASYHCGHNFIATAVKDIPGTLWRRHWHHLVGAQFRLALEAARHGREPAARARLRGQLAAIRDLPALLRRRRSVQRRMRVSAAYIENLMASA